MHDVRYHPPALAAEGDGVQDDATADSPRVLLVDPDADLAEVVVAMLSDEGYAVEVLDESDHDAVAGAVGRLEPDCVLLDASGVDYGPGWSEAAFLAARGRAVPTVMFTAHAGDIREGQAGTSARAEAAQFAAILAKPFYLDELLEAVETATGRSQPFDRSTAGDRTRTEAMERALTDAGATDIRTSTRREWATFRGPGDETLYQIYWWQQLGVYMVGHYDRDARLVADARHHDLPSAIGAALG